MTDAALTRQKTLLGVVFLALMGLAFKGMKTSHAQSFEERYPSAYCLAHNCASCPGSLILLKTPESGERATKQRVDLSPTCWITVAFPYADWMEIDPDTYGYCVRIPRTGQTFFVYPNNKMPTLGSAGLQGDKHYLSLSGLDHVDITVE